MHYFYINEDLGIIKDSNFHHIKNVLKMRTGDNIIVCFSNLCYEAVIEVKEKEILYKKLELIKKEETLNITLFQGMLKGNKIETTIKYATMFGAKDIYLTKMLRSIQKEQPSNNKQSRYETIAKEASMLSKRSSIPNINWCNNIMDYDFSQFDLVILADEEEKSLHLKSLKISSKDNIAIIIGPEGGLDLRERDFFKSINAKIVTFGQNILSSEIACIYILSALTVLT